MAFFVVLGCLCALAGPARAELAIHVQGNQLVDAEGHPIRLLGVNFAGAEYACIQDRGIWSAPTDQAAIEAMAAWQIDVVRIPLNEDCWLGINGAPAQYSGAIYQQAIHEFVHALHEAGLYVILDLQWSAPAANQATNLQPMADSEHSIDFWSSVAQSFHSDPAVLFDLYSEPHEVGWECWLEGCTLPWSDGTSWQAAGMQSLVDTVRSQGATQPLLLGGIEWANDLSGWLAHLPTDPRDQLVASVHIYSTKPCNTEACWSESLGPIAERYPVVAGEIGEFDCEDRFIDQFMNWANANGISYLGWTWNTFDCESGPALISSPDGTPTAFGEGLREHLRIPRTALAVAPSPVAAGQPVTLSVQVESPTATAPPTGTVAFQIDGQALASQPLDAEGQATLSLPRLSVGAHRAHVLYSGSEALRAETSEAQLIEVLPEGPMPTPPSPPPIVTDNESPLTPTASPAPSTPSSTALSTLPTSSTPPSQATHVHLQPPRRIKTAPRKPHKGCPRSGRARARRERPRVAQAREAHGRTTRRCPRTRRQTGT